MNVHVVRLLDLDRIDAVGFDLDHTLAVYDDARVNALACDETCDTLSADGFPSLASARYDETRVCRGLLIDTERGAVVKADHLGRVRRALCRGNWLDGDDRAREYPRGVTVAPGGRFHPIDTPFDLPAAFLFQVDAGRDPAATCRAVRSHLDRAHTRGRFKGRVLDDVDRCVLPFPFDLAAFEHLRAARKRLFVLTNSAAAYAASLLDHLFSGPLWRSLFDVVAADAGKPAFFTGREAALVREAPVVEHAHARWLEDRLGVRAGRVLYVGDSTRSDIHPARAHGWRAAQVVPELSATASALWGSPLFEGNTPTWFASQIARHADVYAPSLADILALDPRSTLEPDEHPMGTA